MFLEGRVSNMSQAQVVSENNNLIQNIEPQTQSGKVFSPESLNFLSDELMIADSFVLCMC